MVATQKGAMTAMNYERIKELAEEGDEIGEGLYNSERDYLGQIAVYKEFQGKGTFNER